MCSEAELCHSSEEKDTEKLFNHVLVTNLKQSTHIVMPYDEMF